MLDLNAPFQSNLHGTEIDINLSRWFQQQQSGSQEAAFDELCSLSLRHRSNRVDCSLKLGLSNREQNPNQAGISTSLSLCLPEDRHECHAGMTSTSQESFSVYDDLRAEITLQEEDMDRFIQQKEAEMYRELKNIREQHATSLASSIAILCEQRIIQKNLELNEIHVKNQELTEKVNEAAAEARRWQFQAWQSQTALSTLQAELEIAHEECGENDMGTRCRICKMVEARILHLPCRHLSVCGGCDQSIDACPICFSPRTQSIEVFLP